MSMLDGLDVEALEDFGDDFRDGYLIVEGEQVSDGRGGFHPIGFPVEHPCKVLVIDYSDRRRIADPSIPAEDRQVLILNASLPAGIHPNKGHKVRAPDPTRGNVLRTFEVVARTGDPAGALSRLQGH